MRSTRPPPVALPRYRHRFMTKHADQGVLKSIDAADEHVEDDGSKEAQVGEENVEETAVSSRGAEAARVAAEEGNYILRIHN